MLAVESLEASLAHVQIGALHGGRKPLGDPALTAPDIESAVRALNMIDPNSLDRGEWISVTSAFKQAAWTPCGPEMARFFWDQWCAKYEKNDTGENDKQWRSIRNTEVGWPSFLRRLPSLKAAQLFGPSAPQGALLNGEVIGPLSLSGKLVGSGVSTDVAAFMNDADLPIAFDTFKGKTVKIGRLPWDREPLNYPIDWTDSDYVELQSWCHKYQIKPSSENVRNAVVLHTNRRRFNSVTNRLNDMEWDGVSRIDNFFIRYFNAKNTQFAGIAGAKFLIGMIARAFWPGCKLDSVIVLEGPQGIGKSSALRILAGAEYFSDGLPNMADKEGYQHLIGKWVVEIAELAALRRSEVEEIKAFITKSEDKFRKPYGHEESEHKRTVVFAATTNDKEYLKDNTGNRRFWPIECGVINLDALARDRDQLLAEAVARYREGEPWWLTREQEAVAAVEQDARQEVDIWTDPVQQYCAPLQTVTMQGIFRFALFMDYRAQDRAKTARVAAILDRIGFKQQRSKSARWYERG